MISEIVALAQKLLGIRETLRGLRSEKRERLAKYLRTIGTSLEDAERDLSAGGSAARACGQLHQYVKLIPPAVDEALGEDETEDLRQSLRRALNVRALPDPSREELDQLLEAAGAFIGLADYLEASS